MLKEDNRRFPSILLTLLLSTLAPLAAIADPPEMTPLAFLTGDAAIGTAPGSQTQPVVARGGDRLLAVWTDASSVSSLAGSQSDLDIVAARLDASGALLDPTPFVISRDAGYQRDPQVAWNGAAWLVAWEHQTFNGSYYETRISAVRVSADGGVLDAAPIQPLGTDAADEFRVAANGSEWLVVTQGYSAGQTGIRGRRIAADGSFPDPSPTLIVPGGGSLLSAVDLDAAGGEYLLSYSGSSSIVGLRLSSTLAPLGSVALPSTLRQVASNGAMYYILWNGGQYGNDMRGSPMSTNGVFTIPAGAFLDDLSDGAWWSHDVAWDGANWWVGYNHAWTGLTFQRVAANGAVVDPVGFAIDASHRNEQGSPRLVARPAGGVLAVWQDSRIAGATSYDIFAARVTGPDPPFDTGTPISMSAPYQTYADLAEGNGIYLIAFTSALSGQSRILVQRLNEAGIPLDLEPIQVASGLSEVAPAVAWNGSSYLCVWNSSGTVVGRRLGADGSFLDPTPVTIMPGSSPDVAALGGDFLVTTTYAPTYPQYRFPFARRVNGSTGQPIDPAPIVLGNSFAQFTRVAALGGRWLVAWQRNFTHDDPQSSVEGAFVEANGTTPGSFSVLFMTGGTPDLAVSDGTAIFLWRNNSLSNANNYIAARRMRADGSFVDAAPFTVSEAPGRQLDPVCAWNGSEFVTAWEDQRNQTSFFDARTELFGARVPEAGAVIDPSGYGVIDGLRPVVNPTIASLGGGQWLVAASVLRQDAPFSGYRIGVRAAGVGAASAPPSPATATLRLAMPRPNPLTRGETVLRYELASAGFVDLRVCDAAGRVVRRLAHGSVPAGAWQAAWDGRDDSGREVGSGIYFIRLESDRAGATRRLVVAR